MHTEIWQGWIILDAHRLSKISGSFHLLTKKEAAAPGWPLLFWFFYSQSSLVSVVNKLQFHDMHSEDTIGNEWDTDYLFYIRIC